MGDDFEYQSWRDRCDRYFSSISDTGKDRDQEKYISSDSENTREKRAKKNEWEDNDDKVWKNLSDVRKAFSEHWLLRNIRKVLFMLDIHGTKAASKTKGTVVLMFWMIIVLISVIAFGILLYFMLREYVDKPSTYRINNIIESKRMGSTDFSLTVCNLNILKRSKVAGSGLIDLNNLLHDKNISASREDKKSVEEEVEANTKLKAFLLKRSTDEFSEFVTSIENDVVVQELTKSSNMPLLYRLSKYGKPELLKEVLQLSKTMVQRAGYAANETLVKCWKDNVPCPHQDIQTKTSSEHGSCITVSALGFTSTVELVLNVQSEDYIDYLSPTVGFTVFLADGSDILPDHMLKISPGYLSTLSINKLTTIRRLDRSCSSSSLSKKNCEDNCLKEHVVRLCGCSTDGEDTDTGLCKMNQASDHICVKSLRRLQLQGNLPCQCQDRCREKELDLQLSTIEWPSKQYTELYGNSIFPGQQNVTHGYLRDNLALLRVHLIPVLTEEIEEHEPFEIMDIFVRIGGISALVAGVSVVTIIEIVCLILYGAVRSVRYMRKRSGSVTSPRRLSDSEITSITWAMYRQRRRFEEANKIKEDKLANNAGVNALGGNVQARILKRSSYAAAENRDIEHAPTSNDNPSRHNGYFRRHDGKNPFYKSRTRESYAKDSDSPNGDNKYGTNGGDYTVNVIRPPRQTDHIYDSRHEPIYTGNVLHPNGIKYQDKNAKERHQQENVFLYDGAVAYFNPSNISEPVYL